MTGKLLMKIARTPLMGRLIGTAFRLPYRLLPLSTTGGDRYCIAFRHPQPAYEDHMILSPRKPVRDLIGLCEETTCFRSLLKTAQTLCSGPTGPFTLVINGGKRQEVQQVHAHLFSGHAMVSGYTGEPAEENLLYRDDSLRLLAHPHPEWEVHAVILPGPAGLLAPAGELPAAYLQQIGRCIALLDHQAGILQKGYSLVCRMDADSPSAAPVFHIAAGKKLS